MIIRREERPRGYSVIPNAMLEDASLSFRARGLLGYLVSRPDGWETDSERLSRIAKEGRDAIRTALRELDAARYIVRGRGQGAQGRWRTEVWVFDAPRSHAERAALLGSLTPVGKSVDNAGDELW